MIQWRVSRSSVSLLMYSLSRYDPRSPMFVTCAASLLSFAIVSSSSCMVLPVPSSIGPSLLPPSSTCSAPRTALAFSWITAMRRESGARTCVLLT